jgi:hypothetical protein
MEKTEYMFYLSLETLQNMIISIITKVKQVLGKTEAILI